MSCLLIIIFQFLLFAYFHISVNILGVGGVSEKRRLVNTYVWDKYQQARKELQQVHDSDLIGWACEEAARLDFDFKASRHWALDWKKRHRIVNATLKKNSRKNHR